MTGLVSTKKTKNQQKQNIPSGVPISSKLTKQQSSTISQMDAAAVLKRPLIMKTIIEHCVCTCSESRSKERSCKAKKHLCLQLAKNKWSEENKCLELDFEVPIEVIRRRDEREKKSKHQAVSSTIMVRDESRQLRTAKHLESYQIIPIVGDGWCGYRAIANILYGNEHQFPKIVIQLSNFIASNEEYYENLMNQPVQIPDEDGDPAQPINNHTYARNLQEMMNANPIQPILFGNEADYQFDLKYVQLFADAYDITIFVLKTWDNEWSCANPNGTRGYACINYSHQNGVPGGHYTVFRSRHHGIPPPVPINDNLNIWDNRANGVPYTDLIPDSSCQYVNVHQRIPNNEYVV
jgi:hypothetical protein